MLLKKEVFKFFGLSVPNICSNCTIFMYDMILPLFVIYEFAYNLMHIGLKSALIRILLKVGLRGNCFIEREISKWSLFPVKIKWALA